MEEKLRKNWQHTYAVSNPYFFSLNFGCDCNFVFLVFYARSFKKEISIPISWWPTTATAPHILASLFWEVVAVCERRNFHIHAIVADGSATNRKFFNIIHGSPFTLSAPSSYTCPNPYRKTMPIFICSDTSHLLKVKTDR